MGKEEKVESNPEQDVEFIENILAQCSVYIAVEARRKVLEAMDNIRKAVKKSVAKDKKDKED